MAKQPPMDPDEPGDDDLLDEEEFLALLTEAQELGVHYTRQGEDRDIHELRAFVSLARQEHGADHPVACYGVSHDPTDRACRICSLRQSCADRDTSPRVEVMGVKQLEDVPCESCGRGLLSEELTDKDTGELLDFRCSTMGCSNTLGSQCGWDEITGRRPTISVEDPNPAEPEPTPAPEPPLSAQEKASTPPVLEVLEGGKSKKKKVVVKKATAKKAPTKKVVVKKAPKKKKPGFAAGTNGLQYRVGGLDEVFDSLTSVARSVTGTRNWSGFKFFKVGKDDLAPGLELVREWKGDTITVTVEATDGSS
jgi:hypothetical protein